MGAPTQHAHTTRTGFTLTELLVVIGIAVLLVGLLVPIGRSLTAGNRAMTCKAQLQQIGTAMKAYYMDEGGAPPFYITEAGDPTDPATYPPTGPGLLALYDAGYLARRRSLHCPSDIDSQLNQDMFYYSYQRLDPDAGVQVPLNAYSYLQTRGVTDDTLVEYRQQLQPAADTDGDTSTPAMPVIAQNFTPDDDTVITWCPFHVDDIVIGGEGAYQVLFWDGSVQRIRKTFMQDVGQGPDAAWKVTHDDSG